MTARNTAPVPRVTRTFRTRSRTGMGQGLVGESQGHRIGGFGRNPGSSAGPGNLTPEPRARNPSMTRALLTGGLAVACSALIWYTVTAPWLAARRGDPGGLAYVAEAERA